MSLALSPNATNVATPQWSDQFGVCQWFHFQDAASLKLTLRSMSELGLKHLRTGISWADYHRSGGREWCDWQMKQLRDAGVEVLLSVWHTPPSLSETGACGGPPRRLQDYADFIDLLITRYGDSFHHLELWNEPNNRYKWDFLHADPGWKKFAEMIGSAAYWANERGMSTVLGGMIPVDPFWLDMMHDAGVLEYIDVVGIHAFPGMWFPHHPNWDWRDRWTGWVDKLAGIQTAARGRPVWVTETGLATWDLATSRPAKFQLQQEKLQDVFQAMPACPDTRFYWYSMIDLDPAREAIEGHHVDENEYHLGLLTSDGFRKHAYDRVLEQAHPFAVAVASAD